MLEPAVFIWHLASLGPEVSESQSLFYVPAGVLAVRLRSVFERISLAEDLISIGKVMICRGEEFHRGIMPAARRLDLRRTSRQLRRS